MPRPGRSRHYYRHDAHLDSAGPRGPLTDARRDLAAAYLPLARKLAVPFGAARPRLRDEFDSAACLGLVDAARDYDPARGIAFATFARVRIRGALAAVAWEQRPIGLDDDATVLSLQRGKGVRAFEEALVDRDTPAPGEEAADLESFERLLRGLPARHAEVCRSYYLHGLTMGEVSGRLGCSPSEVARLHGQAIAMLSGPDGPAGPRRRRARKVAS